MPHWTSTVQPNDFSYDFSLLWYPQPCRLPSWSRYVEYFLVVELVVMFFQSSYILYMRSKTKKVYHIGVNTMGLIQLDRANHCGLCYFLYSIVAVTESICDELVRSGHLDQRWPNFMLGVRFTLSITCAGVILWLSICHFAFVKQAAASHSKTPQGRVLPTTAIWALNTFLVIIILTPSVALITTNLRLMLEYNRVRELVMPIVEHLRRLAPTCSPGTCSVTRMAAQAIGLTQALHHIDRVVDHTVVVNASYTLFNALTILIYTPFVYSLFQRFKTRRELDNITKLQLEGVFANTVTELAIAYLNFILGICTDCLIQNGKFIFNPNYWLLVRIGMSGTIATLGNLTLFLISDNLRRTNAANPEGQILLARFTTPMNTNKSDEITSAVHESP